MKNRLRLSLIIFQMQPLSSNYKKQLKQKYV
nr:MAG TPA: hypothetical protein [Bacteriophage sp.]